MRNVSKLSLAIILAGFGVSGSAAAETLEQALDAAYTSNPTLTAQRAGLRATDELVPQALSNWRPTVRLTGNIGKEYLSSNNLKAPLERSEPLTPKDAGLSVSQPVFRSGRVDALTRQAEAQVKAARAQLVVTEQAVLLSVVTAYSNVVQDQAVVDLNKNNEQVLQRQLDATNDKFRVGEVTRTDVAQAEAALSGARGVRIQAEGILQGDIANFLNTVGHAPVDLKAAPPIGGLPGSSDQAKALALAQNPSIVAQQSSYDAAQAAVDAAFDALLPQISLNGAVTRAEEESFIDSHVVVAQALINLTVPIYQQGVEYSTLRQLKQTAGQQKLLLDAARSSAVQSTSTAWEALRSAHAQVASFTDQVKSAQVTLDGEQRQYQVGSVTLLDVLTAAQNLLNAKVNLVRAQHDETVASYQLRNAIGQLTAQSLKLPVDYYDPTKHYDEVRNKWIGFSSSSDDIGQGK